MKKQILGMLLILLSTNSFALSINMRLHFEGVDTYLAAGKELTGNSSRVSGLVNMTAEQNGQTQTAQEAMPSQLGNNTAVITVLNKHTVQISDYTEGLNVKVPAKVKMKAFSGKVKSITIKGEDYLAAYGEILQRQGVSVLQAFQISTNELTLKTKLVASDYICKASNGTVNCKSSVDLIITAND